MRPRSLVAAAAALLLCTGLAPAQDSRPTTQPSAPQAAPLPPLGHPAGVFGAGVGQGEVLGLRAAAQRVKELHGRPVRIQARIKDVCRKKGCWMVLSDGPLEVRVKFRDYSFFVPRDASKREVLVEGILTETEISEEVAKHYAEEGGNPAEAEKIKGPQKILSFVATGVEVLAERGLPPLASAARPEVAEALAARIAAGKALAPAAEGAVADAAAALARLRALAGSRTVEFSIHTVLEREGVTWYVFSASQRGFSAGFAVARDGRVQGF